MLQYSELISKSYLENAFEKLSKLLEPIACKIGEHLAHQAAAVKSGPPPIYLSFRRTRLTWKKTLIGRQFAQFIVILCLTLPWERFGQTKETTALSFFILVPSESRSEITCPVQTSWLRSGHTNCSTTGQIFIICPSLLPQALPTSCSFFPVIPNMHNDHQDCQTAPSLLKPSVGTRGTQSERG